MTRTQITPVVLTFDEAPNLERTLKGLTWANQVLVLDSFSRDETVSIAARFPNVRVMQRTFDDFAGQFSAAANACSTEWVLALDADHVLTPELESELQVWEPMPGVDAYLARFRYCVAGVPLRASLYPPRVVLFRRTRCRYVQEGHHQVLLFDGKPGWLAGRILHDDRKPLSRWFVDQDKYARQEAEKLRTSPFGALGWPDRLRQMIVIGPPLVFLYTLLARGLALDGWPGWFYTCQRTLAEIMLSLRLAEARVNERRRDG